METQTAVTGGTTQFSDPSVFTGLLDREFKPKGDQQREAVEAAVRTLAEQALGNTVTMSDDAYASIEAIIAEIDQKLTAQINLILHHPDFQAIEAAWRGLDHLVSNTETDEMLKIRFMDISKTELRRTMRRFKGIAWDQTSGLHVGYHHVGHRDLEVLQRAATGFAHGELGFGDVLAGQAELHQVGTGAVLSFLPRQPRPHYDLDQQSHLERRPVPASPTVSTAGALPGELCAQAHGAPVAVLLGLYGRGVQCDITVDEDAFSGISPYLLGVVLEHYLSRHVSINVFTQTRLESMQRGQVASWPVRMGTRGVV